MLIVFGSKKCLVEKVNIFFQFFLAFLQDPFSKIGEIEPMFVLDSMFEKPFKVIREVIRQLISAENSIDHMAAEKSHFDFVSEMTVDTFVIVDLFEDMRSGGTVSKFEILERGVRGCFEIEGFGEIFNRNRLVKRFNQGESVFEEEITFHVRFLESVDETFVIFGFSAGIPALGRNFGFFELIWHFFQD